MKSNVSNLKTFQDKMAHLFFLKKEELRSININLAEIFMNEIIGCSKIERYYLFQF